MKKRGADTSVRTISQTPSNELIRKASRRGPESLTWSGIWLMSGQADQCGNPISSFGSLCATLPDETSEFGNKLEIRDIHLLECSLLVRMSKQPEVLV